MKRRQLTITTSAHLAAFVSLFLGASAPAQNHVLELSSYPASMVVPDHPSLNPTQALTIEFWCFPQNEGSFARVVNKRGGSFGSYSLATNAGPSSCPDATLGADLFTQGPSTFPWGIPCSTVTPCGQWNHFALVVDCGAGQVRWYENGVLSSTCSVAPFALVDSGDPFRLGYTPGFGSTQFKGRLDNVRVWTSARTQEQIQALMFVDVLESDVHLYPDLGASWGFESGGSDATGVNGGTLEGGAAIVQEDLPFDCNANGLPDPDDIAAGTSQDCNANGIPDECDVLQPGLDCDANGLLDSCELAAGTANDCDSNGLIDTCEIAADAGLDVNANGVLDACECLVENYCIAQGNSAGTIASISSSGQPPSLGLNLFGLQVQGAPPQKFGLFFFGTQDHFALLGEGALCVKPPLKRIYPLLVTDSSGAVSLQLDLWPGPAPLDNIQPGQSRYFQFWYRDPLGGPAGFNFSDGLKVTFCP